ncbi:MULTISPECIES: alpha/beta hydrolase-fold protein [unclassified Ochrobactrum]|uniref:alpha/beta hydrolase n=1 Tax=unclassified Ochrobactrum TaxID=239106 RepID=UPI000DEEF055|nr:MULTISPECIES: alpha/beta hydrolase-fold protein [unclassified Ochrobactrum]MBQ0707582.1 alpha/beta hydrolase [Ochrobactrum sp. AP1BH01-1]
MSVMTIIIKWVCLIMTGILTASTVQAAEPVTSSFDMEANGVAYRIFTAAPKGAAPEGGYPVIYMIDGNRMLPIAASRMAENPALKAVFVGIGYPTDNQEEIVRLRYFDLTPPTPDDLIPVHFNVPKTGGRDAFFDFIDNQVKPEIEKRFNIDKDRQALFGHSLGGLFTLYALFNHTDSFQSYSAADPSIWWNNRSILKNKDQFITSFKGARRPIRLLIETSGKRGSRSGQTKKDEDRLKKLRGGPSGSDIFKELSRLPQMDAAFRRFDGESHGSMIPLTVEDSLNFILLGQVPLDKNN